MSNYSLYYDEDSYFIPSGGPTVTVTLPSPRGIPRISITNRPEPFKPAGDLYVEGVGIAIKPHEKVVLVSDGERWEAGDAELLTE